MALVASSATFGLADVLCDICITEHEVDEHDQTVETAADEDEDEEEGVELSNSGMACTSVAYQRSPTAAQHGALEAPTFDERLAASAAAVEEEEGLSGSQDAAIAGERLPFTSGHHHMPTQPPAGATSTTASLPVSTSATADLRTLSQYGWQAS